MVRKKFNKDTKIKNITDNPDFSLSYFYLLYFNIIDRINFPYSLFITNE